MPPRSGGSSSHSSSSHSSSRSSSSHSSSSFSSSRSSSYGSSRSSSSFSGRPSSHSSSSHSSFGSSYSRSPSRSSSGPSTRSSSSYSSRPSGPAAGPAPSRAPQVPPKPIQHIRYPVRSFVPPITEQRPSEVNEAGTYYVDPVRTHRERVNQPPYPSKDIVPWIFYGRLHDYLHFSRDWDYDGQSYAAGYYDEDGNHYAENEVIFDGQSEAAPATLSCEYCGSSISYAPSTSGSMNCPNCSAPLQIPSVQAIHDTLLYKESYHPNGDRPVFTQRALKDFERKYVKKNKNNRIGLKIAVFAAAVWFAVANFIAPKLKANDHPDSVDQPVQIVQTTQLTNPQLFGQTLYLTEEENGIYALGTMESNTFAVFWDEQYECYYDAESDAYLWYNTDVSPNLWQYWFEGISSECGDYGWMECEGDTWYIQNARGNWVEYTGDTSRLWHIHNSFDD